MRALQKIVVVLLSGLLVAGCGMLGDMMERQKAIRKAVEAASGCDDIRFPQHNITNGIETVVMEAVGCEVADPLAEAERLNSKLLAAVPSYKKIDRFTYVFVNRGVRQSIDYAEGKRVTE